MLKASQGKGVGFSRLSFFLSLAQPVCHWGASQWASEEPRMAKCERSHLSIRPLVDALLTHHYSAPPANGFCEQLEVDFPSVSDHSISISGQGAPTVELSGQKTRFSSSSGPSFAIYSSQTVRGASLPPLYIVPLP